MAQWLENSIEAMSVIDYRMGFLLLTLGWCYLLYYSYHCFRRFRFINATATSKIRSAAQGQVELKGLGEWLPNGRLQSPFSNRRCIWYHCTIEQRQRSGKRVTWINIVDDCSDHLFRLEDETGECIIDPDHAHVIPEIDLIWYGHNTDFKHDPPGRKRWIPIRTGGYRFRERLLLPASPLYILGWLQTVQNDPAIEYVATQTDELVKLWKLQPERYLRKFDFDRNGKIQDKEWTAIEAAARHEVMTRIINQQQEQHVVARAPDRRLPYILSAVEEDLLVASNKRKANCALASAFVLFCTLVTLFAMRNPLPV